MSKRWWHLYRVYNAWVSRQVYALHEPAAWFVVVVKRSDDLWQGHTRVKKIHASVAQ